MMRALTLAACAACVLATVPAVADASKRHGTRPDGEQRDRDRHDGHGDRKGDEKKGHGDKGSELGDKPIGEGSCAKRVRELKKTLAKLSYLSKANGGCMGEDENWAVDAFQRQEGLRATGKADRKTLKRLDKAKQPKPRKGGDNDRLLVSIRRQLLYIVEKDEVRRTISVSSGRSGFETPRGHYKIFRKERNSYSNEFDVNLPWASYFHNGMAFHGSSDVQPRGASHGCIRVPPKFAREVYRKAPMGRQVIVF
jgi:peptidoglycan hydrolase-like protein with peptidoglycan-binding domain